MIRLSTQRLGKGNYGLHVTFSDQDFITMFNGADPAKVKGRCSLRRIGNTLEIVPQLDPKRGYAIQRHLRENSDAVPSNYITMSSASRLGIVMKKHPRTLAHHSPVSNEDGTHTFLRVKIPASLRSQDWSVDYGIEMHAFNQEQVSVPEYTVKPDVGRVPKASKPKVATLDLMATLAQQMDDINKTVIAFAAQGTNVTFHTNGGALEAHCPKPTYRYVKVV